MRDIYVSFGRIKDGLVEAGLLVANEGGQQQEEVGYLQLLHHLKDQIGPQMRLDLVEFELRHLKVIAVANGFYEI